MDRKVCTLLRFRGPMKNPPDPTREYVLVYDHPAYAETPAEVLVPRDTVVTNVRFKPNHSYIARAMAGGTELEFTVKATGEQHTTNYGYMFALNTPENLSRLEIYRRARAQTMEAEAVQNRAYEQVDMVKGPFEGYFGHE